MGALFSIIGTIASFILTAIIPYLICFGLGWYCCNKWHHHGEERVVATSERVLTIESGAEFSVRAGLLGHQSRVVSLWGIEIPSEVTEMATTSLRSIISVGDTVEVELKEGKRIGRADQSGIVIHSGTNCNLEQLRRGWAKATVTDKAFVAAQTEAQKERRGIWKSVDPDKPHHPHFPFWKEEIGD